MEPEEAERRVTSTLEAMGPGPRGDLLHLLLLPEEARPAIIARYWADPSTRTLAELLIDLELRPKAREALVALLRASVRG